MAQITSEVTGSLNSIGGFTQRKAVDPNALYQVNWNKVTQTNKSEDLILVLGNVLLILQSLGFVFSPQHPNWESIKSLLDIENPIYPQQPVAEEKEIKLPKIKKV